MDKINSKIPNSMKILPSQQFSNADCKTMREESYGWKQLAQNHIKKQIKVGMQHVTIKKATHNKREEVSLSAILKQYATDADTYILKCHS